MIMAVENTKSLIRSCVVSTKNGLTVRQLARDFEDLVGSPIPYQEHGFQSLDLFLRSIPDTVRLTSVGNETVVEHVADASVARIASLVSRQKSSKQNKTTLLTRKKPLLKKRPGAGQLKSSRRLSTGSTRPHQTEERSYNPGGGGLVQPGLTPAPQKPAPLDAGWTQDAGPTRSVHIEDRSRSGDADPARLAAPRRRPAFSTQVSISSSDLGGGGRPVRAAPALCQRHRPPHVCQRRPCDALHLCRLYVDGFCPQDDATCPWGHMVKSADNRNALAAYQLEALPERELFWLVCALLRQTVPVAAEEYRRQLALCAEYVANARCRRPDCFQLHLCPRLVAGECRDGAGCRWSHNLADADNVMVLLRLKCADLSEKEVLARLARQAAEDEPGDSSDGRAAGLTDTAEVASRSSPRQQIEPPKVPTSTGKALNTSMNGQLAKDCKQQARNMELCRHNIPPSTCPQGCEQLHLCRFYIAGMCLFGRRCKSGHKLCDSPHNRNVLRKHGLQQLSEAELLEAIKTGYLSRNPITDLERQFALQMCLSYQTGSCHETICTRLHICAQYVLGNCKNGSGCEQSHQLSNPIHAAIIRRVGLSSLSHGELRDVLNNPPAAKDVWLSSASASSGSATTSGPARMVYLSSTADPVSDDGPSLCAVHASGGRCQRTDCDDFHICGFFLANLCHRPDRSCPLGHFFDSAHNQRVMELHGLMDGSPDQFQELIDLITLRERITFGNNAQSDVRLCVPYNSAGGCAEHCGRFHVCHRFLAGSCHGKACELRHDIAGAHNRRVREVLGLESSPGPGRDAVWATDRDLTELLRARLGVSPGVYPSPELITGCLPCSSCTSPSKSAPLPSASRAGPSKSAPLPSVCGRLSAGQRCPNARCAAIHICPHYLVGACRRQNCTLGHRLTTDRNQEALQLSGRTVTEQNHDSVLKEVFAASPYIPRPEAYTRLRICICHNRSDGCHVSDCIKIHICQKFVAGTCGGNCDLGHVIDTKCNRKKLRAMDLGDASVDEVLEMLRAVHGFRSVYVP